MRADGLDASATVGMRFSDPSTSKGSRAGRPRLRYRERHRPRADPLGDGLEPTDDGRATELTFAMEIRGSMLTAFVEPMIASAAGGDIDTSLARLQGRSHSAGPDRPHARPIGHGAGHAEVERAKLASRRASARAT